MPGRQSLRLVPTRHHHFGGFDGLVLAVSARGAAAPRAGAVEVHSQCCARWQSERCGAACRLVSLAHRGWQVVSGPWWYSQLRQSYITPHCMKYPASQSQAPLCPSTASRPAGLRSGMLCKIACAGAGASAAGAPRSVPALRAAACRPGGVRALWHMSGASRGCFGQWPAAMCVVCAPPTPRALPASRHRRAGCASAPKGSLQCRAEGRVQGGQAGAARLLLLSSPAAHVGLTKQSYIRPYIVTKEKGFAITFITANP